MRGGHGAVQCRPSRQAGLRPHESSPDAPQGDTPGNFRLAGAAWRPRPCAPAGLCEAVRVFAHLATGEGRETTHPCHTVERVGSRFLRWPPRGPDYASACRRRGRVAIASREKTQSAPRRPGPAMPCQRLGGSPSGVFEASSMKARSGDASHARAPSPCHAPHPLPCADGWPCPCHLIEGIGARQGGTGGQRSSHDELPGCFLLSQGAIGTRLSRFSIVPALITHRTRQVTDQDVERVVDKEGLVFLFVAMAQADKLKRGTSLDPETVDHSVYFKTLDELLDVREICFCCRHCSC
eukprot:scaffold375_cov378-Prasinococcus_capsulatus_cf.AAC.6